MSRASFNSAVASLASWKLGTPPNTSLGIGSPASITRPSSPSAKSQSSHAAGTGICCAGATSPDPEFGADVEEVKIAETGRDALRTECPAGGTAGMPRRPWFTTPIPATLAAALMAPPPPMALETLTLVNYREKLKKLSLSLSREEFESKRTRNELE
jgi:hypothetical protein